MSIGINESLVFSALSHVVSIVFVGNNRFSNTDRDPDKELVVLYMSQTFMNFLKFCFKCLFQVHIWTCRNNVYLEITLLKTVNWTIS